MFEPVIFFLLLLEIPLFDNLCEQKRLRAWYVSSASGSVSASSLSWPRLFPRAGLLPLVI